jgi:hypothetical protein
VKYHIDVSSVLRKTVCDLYTNLVTRPTGVAVRQAIEAALAELPEPNVTYIDFGKVRMLDFSCADEIVGKLLDFYQHAEGQPQRYFLIRGVHDGHVEAIEAVLGSYNLAVIVEEEDGNLRLLGKVDEGARRAWHAVNAHGRMRAHELEVELGQPAETATRVLDHLSSRRLLMRRDDGYFSLAHAL